MHLRKRLFALALAATGSAGLFAQPGLSDLLAKALASIGGELAQIVSKPLSADFYFDSVDYRGGRWSVVARRALDPGANGAFSETFEVEGKYSERLEQDFALRTRLATNRYLDAMLAKEAAADRTEIGYDVGRGTWKSVDYLSGKVCREKETKAGRGAFYLGSIHWAMKALLMANSRESFSCDVAMATGEVFGAEAACRRYASMMDASSAYAYPPRFAEAAKALGACYVWELRLTGIAGVMYPHKFYYAFKDAPGYPLAAIFGKDPRKDAMYQVLLSGDTGMAR